MDGYLDFQLAPRNNVIEGVYPAEKTLYCTRPQPFCLCCVRHNEHATYFRYGR